MVMEGSALYLKCSDECTNLPTIKLCMIKLDTHIQINTIFLLVYSYIVGLVLPRVSAVVLPTLLGSSQRRNPQLHSARSLL